MHFDFDVQYPFRRKMEIPVPKTVRTYIDAYESLIRGNEVRLTVNPHLVDAPVLVLTPWQYGRRDCLSQVRKSIEAFRESHRPYAGVKWELVKIKYKTQVQLQNSVGHLVAGSTAVLDQLGSHDGSEDPALYFQMNFHGSRYIKAKWIDLWENWELVDVNQREACLAGVEYDMGRVIEILKNAKSGDRVSAAAFDWLTYHRDQKPWWSMGLDDLRGSSEYKAWERKIFERHLSNIFKVS